MSSNSLKIVKLLSSKGTLLKSSFSKGFVTSSALHSKLSYKSSNLHLFDPETLNFNSFDTLALREKFRSQNIPASQWLELYKQDFKDKIIQKKYDEIRRVDEQAAELFKHLFMNDNILNFEELKPIISGQYSVKSKNDLEQTKLEHLISKTQSSSSQFYWESDDLNSEASLNIMLFKIMQNMVHHTVESGFLKKKNFLDNDSVGLMFNNFVLAFNAVNINPVRSLDESRVLNMLLLTDSPSLILRYNRRNQLFMIESIKLRIKKLLNFLDRWFSLKYANEKKLLHFFDRWFSLNYTHEIFKLSEETLKSTEGLLHNINSDLPTEILVYNVKLDYRDVYRIMKRPHLDGNFHLMFGIGQPFNKNYEAYYNSVMEDISRIHADKNVKNEELQALVDLNMYQVFIETVLNIAVETFSFRRNSSKTKYLSCVDKYVN